MPDIVDILVPAIGDFADVPIIDVLVKVGDEVEAEDSLITVESDKATLDVPSPVAGVITELLIKVGDKISAGVLVARVKVSSAEKVGDGDTAALAEKSLETPVDLAPAVAVSAAPAAPTAIATSAPVTESSATAGTHTHASPSVRAFARTLG
ncbi:MAG TPA: biotin/lipoyl-containing protein, partial [Rugosibacter sp.]